MKRGTTQVVKFKKLCKSLGLPPYAVVGVLESLWHMTARETPRGDVGKLTNEEIAIGIDWDGDPDVLVGALIENKWLDASDRYRLIVHDWHIHADDTTKKAIERSGETFCAHEPDCPDISRQIPTNPDKKRLPEPKPKPEPVPEPLPEPDNPPVSPLGDESPPEKPPKAVKWWESVDEPCRGVLCEIATVSRFEKYLVKNKSGSLSEINGIWLKASRKIGPDRFREEANSFASFYRTKRHYDDGVAAFRNWLNRSMEKLPDLPKPAGSAAPVDVNSESVASLVRVLKGMPAWKDCSDAEITNEAIRRINSGGEMAV